MTLSEAVCFHASVERSKKNKKIEPAGEPISRLTGEHTYSV
jgi:hypothetical protein